MIKEKTAEQIHLDEGHLISQHTQKTTSIDNHAIVIYLTTAATLQPAT
jgi:hypothetical protein